MTENEKIKQALKQFNQGASLTIQGVVKSVNEDEATCSVNIGETILIEDVRLRSVVDKQTGFYLIPKIDSQVLLLRICDSNDFIIIGFSEYNKVIIKGENVSFRLTNDQIIFNENALSSFIPDINKLVTKLNNIENDLNSIKTVFKNWTPAPQDGGATLKAASATWAAQSFTTTKKDDIKDPKILN